MKVISRSQWTSTVPNSTTGTEDTQDLPNFRQVKGISVFAPDSETLFVEKNPTPIFNTLFKEDLGLRGYGDIQWNLGISSNTVGPFILRGLCNKSAAHGDKKLNNSYVSILVLLGNREPPSDQLLLNLLYSRELVLKKWPEATEVKVFSEKVSLHSVWDDPPPVGVSSSQFTCPLPNSFTTETSVHVHDLIEFLSYWGYYNGRNDAVYGPITRQAVSSLQADLKDGGLYHKPIDGSYGRYTREAFCLYLKSLGT